MFLKYKTWFVSFVLCVQPFLLHAPQNTDVAAGNILAPSRTEAADRYYTADRSILFKEGGQVIASDQDLPISSYTPVWQKCITSLPDDSGLLKACKELRLTAPFYVKLYRCNAGAHTERSFKVGSFTKDEVDDSIEYVIDIEKDNGLFYRIMYLRTGGKDSYVWCVRTIGPYGSFTREIILFSQWDGEFSSLHAKKSAATPQYDIYTINCSNVVAKNAEGKLDFSNTFSTTKDGWDQFRNIRTVAEKFVNVSPWYESKNTPPVPLY